MAKRSTKLADVTVGENIRILRLEMRLTQTELGRRVGVTFQQIQKYEKGLNRVSASRLSMLADALAVPLPLLFEGISPGGVAEPEESVGALLARPHALRLMHAFDEIASDATRNAVRRLIDAIAELQPKNKESRI